MACVNPRWYTYKDGYSGEIRHIQIPCGHCACCLHAKHDAMAIRVKETAKHFPAFVYDTLTFRNESMQWLDVSDVYYSSRVSLRVGSLNYIRKYYPDWQLPIFPKKIFSDWIKRGRAGLEYKYGKCPILKFLCCMEYGPKSSRPHAHLIMFGVSHADYIQFFAKPWRERYGFTKTKYIDQRTGNRQKDLSCISAYITKYVDKGNFDSALVKDGLQPKPWRQLSNGIGAEYCFNGKEMVNSKFNFLYTDVNNISRSFSGVDYTPLYNLAKDKYEPYRESGFGFVPQGDNFSLTRQQISYLTTYYDEGGYPHHLPRYYYDKLLGRDPNLLKYEVSNCLLQDAEQRRYQEVSKFAADVGCVGADKYSSEAEVLGLFDRVNPLWRVQYLTQQKNKRELREAGYKTKLKNLYKRPLRTNAPIT